MNDDRSSVRKVRNLIADSRRNYAELLSVTAQLVNHQEQDIAQRLVALNTLPLIPPQAWTLSLMRRQFQNFPKARKHFHQQYGVKANNWQTLVERVNAIEVALVHLGLGARTQPDGLGKTNISE